MARDARIFPGANIAGSYFASCGRASSRRFRFLILRANDPAAPNYATGAVEKYNTNQFDTRGDYYKSDKLRFVRTL